MKNENLLEFYRKTIEKYEKALKKTRDESNNTLNQLKNAEDKYLWDSERASEEKHELLMFMEEMQVRNIQLEANNKFLRMQMARLRTCPLPFVHSNSNLYSINKRNKAFTKTKLSSLEGKREMGTRSLEALMDDYTRFLAKYKDKIGQLMKIHQTQIDLLRKDLILHERKISEKAEQSENNTKKIEDLNAEISQLRSSKKVLEFKLGEMSAKQKDDTDCFNQEVSKVKCSLRRELEEEVVCFVVKKSKLAKRYKLRVDSQKLEIGKLKKKIDQERNLSQSRFLRLKQDYDLLKKRSNRITKEQKFKIQGYKTEINMFKAKLEKIQTEMVRNLNHTKNQKNRQTKSTLRDKQANAEADILNQPIQSCLDLNQLHTEVKNFVVKIGLSPRTRKISNRTKRNMLRKVQS
eukprot:augustus_masked-scaffold_2-processed-gene-22.42-mRNA-1 protein AED:1.00 eAED:1.00 QI:0/-1/0/0/-1/1/1/0/405